VAATEWTQYVIPFADFKPTEAGANPSLNWHAVRVLNFHLLCEAGGGNLAPLHLDGIAAGAWRREGGNRCKTTALAWAEQLLSPGHCSEWPNLRMILWTHDRREQRGRTLDYRIPDFRAFGSLLGRDACFSGRIPPPVPAAQ
jgi:hypothetical protein